MQNVSNQIQHYPVDLNIARFDLKTAPCRFKNSTQFFDLKTAPCRLKCRHPLNGVLDLFYKIFGYSSILRPSGYILAFKRPNLQDPALFLV